MTPISTTDTIMASAVHRGVTVASVNCSGFASVADVIMRLRGDLGAIGGMVSIKMRNYSRGWTADSQLYLR